MNTIRFFRHSSRLFNYYVPTEFVLLAVIEFFILMLSLSLALEVWFYDHDSAMSFVSYLPRVFFICGGDAVEHGGIRALSETARTIS